MDCVYLYTSLDMPKSAILTTLPGPLVVSKQFRAAMSRWMKRFCSMYLQPFATSIAHINRSFIVRGDGRPYNKHHSPMSTAAVKLLSNIQKLFVPPMTLTSQGHNYRLLFFDFYPKMIVIVSYGSCQYSDELQTGWPGFNPSQRQRIFFQPLYPDWL